MARRRRPCAHAPPASARRQHDHRRFHRCAGGRGRARRHRRVRQPAAATDTCPDGVAVPSAATGHAPPGGSPGPPARQPVVCPRLCPRPGPHPSGPGQSPQPTPASNAAPFVGGKVWRSQSLGYSFEYDDSLWTLGKEDDAFAQLLLGPVEVDVIGYPSEHVGRRSAAADPQELTPSLSVGRPTRAATTPCLGPGIGYVQRQGRGLLRPPSRTRTARPATRPA